MKKIFSLATAALLTLGMQAQTIDLPCGTDLTGGAEVDLNNDGYLDLVYGGRARGGADATGYGRVVTDGDGNEVKLQYNAFQRIWNPATSSYDVKEFQNVLGERVNMIFADFNGDGIMDYVLANAANGSEYTNNGSLWIGNGDGTFTQQEITFDDDTYHFNAATAIDVADFNCDGLPDIVATGWLNIDGNIENANAVLLNQGNFHFKVTSRDLMAYNNNYDLALDLVKVGDFNNDGYPDFMIGGNADHDSGPTKNGATMGRVFEVYMNIGQDAIDEGEEISFYGLDIAGTSAIHHLGNPNFVVADFNNDGYSDIFATGESPNDGKGSGVWDYCAQMLINNKDGGFTPMTQSLLPSDIRPLNTTHYGVRAMDFNGNGYYDLFLPGWCTSMPDGTANTQAGFWFTNSGTGLMNAYTRVPGGSEIGVFFMENGVQGARNYAYAGGTWDGTYFNDDQKGRLFYSETNTNAKAARPDAPTALSVSITDAEKGNVELSWTPATTSKKNVTYEYFIKKSDGTIYNSCTSFIGGDNDGVRKALYSGNAYQCNKIKVNNLPDGNYTWGVQTINASLEGSVFATANLKVGSGVEGVTESANDIKIIAADGAITVKCDGMAVANVYNMQGALIQQVDFNDNCQIAVAQGAYVVKIASEKSNKVEKVTL